jgi:cell wall-associated NlpC family hydrolase
MAASLGWIGQGSAQADTLSDAKAKLSQLQGEASQADEQYNQVQAQLDAAQVKLDQDKQSIIDQQAKVDALRSQVVTISLQQFQDRGILSTAMLLTSENQSEALSNFVVTSMVADTTTSLLQNYQLSQATLADLERAQQTTVDSIATDKARLEELKNQASSKVQEAQRVVDRLTAEEQERIRAANAAALAARTATGTGEGASNGQTSYTPPPPVQNGPAAQAIVDWAMARVGYPYVYGGSGPNSYDCSGFTMAAYAQVGIRLPHSATTQFNYGSPVAQADLQPGDLVFFYSGPGHVGIYVGGGMIVDARNEAIGVVYRSLDGAMPIVGARRLL